MPGDKKLFSLSTSRGAGKWRLAALLGTLLAAALVYSVTARNRKPWHDLAQVLTQEELQLVEVADAGSPAMDDAVRLAQARRLVMERHLAGNEGVVRDTISDLERERVFGADEYRELSDARAERRISRLALELRGVSAAIRSGRVPTVTADAFEQGARFADDDAVTVAVNAGLLIAAARFQDNGGKQVGQAKLAELLADGRVGPLLSRALAQLEGRATMPMSDAEAKAASNRFRTARAP